MNERDLLIKIARQIYEEIQDLLDSDEEIDDELIDLINNSISLLANRIQKIDAQEQQQQPPFEPFEPSPQQPPLFPPQQPTLPLTNIPQGADLLWVLAGGNEQAFREYLSNIPDPELNALTRAQVDQIVARLHDQVTLPAGEVEDGIAKAPLNSSNVYGFRYDPRNGNLLVRFNSGAIYQYDNVPTRIFKLFRDGAAVAKTTGQNKWGAWWRGKTPTLGAAFHQYIRDRFNYRRLS